MFVGSYMQLWYFPALIFSVVVISALLSKRVSLKKITVIAFFFYVMGLLTESWFGVIRPLQFSVPEFWNFLKAVKMVIFTTRDGLFEGLLFVAMGAIVAFYGFKIRQRNALIGFLVTYSLMFIEALGLKCFGFVRARDVYLFLVPLAWFAFGLVVNQRIQSSSSIFKTLRNLSSLIFYIHLWVKWFIVKFFSVIGFEIDKTCLLFILTVGVSVAVSYMIYTVSDNKYFSLLKKLYS